MTSKTYEEQTDYYVQDSRSYTGNCMMWWRQGGGYTSDINKAQVWTYQDAMTQAMTRSSDKPWPCDFIKQRTQTTVDMQYVSRKDLQSFIKLMS